MKKAALFMYAVFVGGNILAQGNSFPSSGNPSIGTSSPSDAIATYSSMFFGFAGVLEGHGATSAVFLNCNGYRQTGGSYYYRQTAPFSGMALANGNISFETASSGTAGTTISKETKMMISLNGNVGIGTTTPGYKVEAVSESPLGLRLQTNNSSIAGPLMDLYDNGRTQESIISSTDGTVTGMYIATYTNHPILFSTNHSSAQAVLTTQGNMGIGTTTPAEKLSVNGNISAKKILVTQNGWPDYVFDRKYNLRSLTEVERFILKNKHLPEMPSSTEVSQKGISIGDSQALLLKKIEELTLYMIQLRKIIDKQQSQIQQLQKQ